MVKDTNASIDEKQKDIVNKTEEKAKLEQELVKTKETHEKVVSELETLSEEAADLHGECDFVLKNFEIRQTARASEIEALKQVKQILSGAKFSDFLQSSAFADDGSQDFNQNPAESLPTRMQDADVDSLQSYLNDDK